ncbi:MAG: phosphodiester glycosidase family protein [Gemmatimonadota bacterium]|nr:phosphodiester glycosidase family protein [Gemmatimonadota bacterium]
MLFALCLLSACTRAGGRNLRDERIDALARSVADSVFAEQLAPGVRMLRLVHLAEPWRAALLEVNLDACVSIRAVKGAAVAVGRTTTSALLAGIDPALRPLAAVNADFFLFTPPGVPTNAHVERGRLLSGPIGRAVFAMTDRRRPWIGVLTSATQLQTARGVISLTTWNRPTAGMSGVVDNAWGIPLDSVVRRNAWILAPVATSSSKAIDQRYVATRLSSTRAPMITGDTLLIVGVGDASTDAGSIVAGDTVRVARALAPLMPVDAVGGQPQLLRDSVVLGTVDSAGNAGFRGLNPRTVIGYGNNGKRVLLAVIDGRQPGYSLGMTLRQEADLFRALGATHALNLDGGGSSVMVVSDARAASRVRLLTHPSDSVGQRPVANALAVLRSCKR